MASTRNKNTLGNYEHEVRQNRLQQQYDLYPYSQHANAYEKALPTFGFNPSKMPASNFSLNPIEIESGLFGIGSTNLVKPQSTPAARFKTMREVSYFDRPEKVIMPKPLILDKKQRPMLH